MCLPLTLLTLGNPVLSCVTWEALDYVNWPWKHSKGSNPVEFVGYLGRPWIMSAGHGNVPQAATLLKSFVTWGGLGLNGLKWSWKTAKGSMIRLHELVMLLGVGWGCVTELNNCVLLRLHGPSLLSGATCFTCSGACCCLPITEAPAARLTAPLCKACHVCPTCFLMCWIHRKGIV